MTHMGGETALPGEGPPSEESSWRLTEGDEIAPGLTALRGLGGGRRYEVCLAFSDRLWTTCVVKLVRPGLVGETRAMAGLTREANLLSRLAHPVVVRGFGAVLDGERPHLVLEHLEGPRLSTLLRRYGPLSAEQLVPLAIELAAALHYLASEGVVHLDVKPSNVIMGAPPRLIDLSLARSAEEATQLTRAVGTAAYMAPEQCRPAELGPVAPKADVWGFGATLYEAVSGELAFEPRSDDPSTPEERWPQLREPARPLDGVPAALAEPILACLAPEPADRPSARAVAEALEDVLGALPAPGRRRAATR